MDYNLNRMTINRPNIIESEDFNIYNLLNGARENIDTKIIIETIGK